MDTEYIDRKITELRDVLLVQVRDLADRIASLRDEVRELRLRNEKLESQRSRRY